MLDTSRCEQTHVCFFYLNSIKNDFNRSRKLSPFILFDASYFRIYLASLIVGGIKWKTSGMSVIWVIPSSEAENLRIWLK